MPAVNKCLKIFSVYCAKKFTLRPLDTAHYYMLKFAFNFTLVCGCVCVFLFFFNRGVYILLALYKPGFPFFFHLFAALVQCHCYETLKALCGLCFYVARSGVEIPTIRVQLLGPHGKYLYLLPVSRNLWLPMPHFPTWETQQICQELDLSD